MGAGQEYTGFIKKVNDYRCLPAVTINQEGMSINVCRVLHEPYVPSSYSCWKGNRLSQQLASSSGDFHIWLWLCL